MVEMILWLNPPLLIFISSSKLPSPIIQCEGKFDFIDDKIKETNPQVNNIKKLQLAVNQNSINILMVVISTYNNNTSRITIKKGQKLNKVPSQDSNCLTE